MTRRVAITGASGFVGGPLVEALTRRGYLVRAGVRRPVAAAPGVEVVAYGDLARPVDWSAFVAGMDAVVHLAGIAHTQGIPDERYDQVNHLQTAALATAARHAGVARFVFVSSIRAQIGAAATTVLSEASEPRPSDAYGRSKLAGEHAVSASTVPFTVLRPVLIYGPHVKGNLATLYRLARLPLPLPLGGLTNERSLCSLAGLLDAIALVLESPAAAEQTYIVADRAPIAVRDLMRALRRGLGRRSALVPVPAAAIGGLLRLLGRTGMWERISGRLVVDPARLVALGWSPRDTATELERLGSRLGVGSGPS